MHVAGASNHFFAILAIDEHPSIHTANTLQIKNKKHAKGYKNMTHKINTINQYIALMTHIAP